MNKTMVVPSKDDWLVVKIYQHADGTQTINRNPKPEQPAMTTPMPIETPIMTLKECAAYLKVHPSTIYRMLARGELPAIKIGSDWRFHVDTIDAWSRAHTVPPGVSK